MRRLVILWLLLVLLLLLLLLLLLQNLGEGVEHRRGPPRRLGALDEGAAARRRRTPSAD